MKLLSYSAFAALCITALLVLSSNHSHSSTRARDAHQHTGDSLSARAEMHCPDRPAPTVRLDPVDLTTDLDGDGVVPTIWIDNYGEPVDSQVLSEVARGAALVRWPSGEAIEAEILATNVAPRMVAEDSPKGATPPRMSQITNEEASVIVAPKTTLAPGWYAIRMNGKPQGLQLAAKLRKLDTEDGGLLVRFHVGSNPVMTAVQVCEKEGGKQAVIVEFSEPVHLSRKTRREQNVVSRADAALTGCTFPKDGERVSHYVSVCDRLPAGNRRLRLDATDILASRDAAKPVALPPQSRFARVDAIDLDVDRDMMPTQERCRGATF